MKLQLTVSGDEEDELAGTLVLIERKPELRERNAATRTTDVHWAKFYRVNISDSLAMNFI